MVSSAQFGWQPYQSKPYSCRGRVGIWFSKVTLGYCEVMWTRRGFRHLQGGEGLWHRAPKAGSSWGHPRRDLKRPWAPGRTEVSWLGDRRAVRETKDFSCTASDHTDEYFHGDKRCQRGPRDVGTLLLAALWSQHHHLPWTTATLKRGAVGKNLRDWAIYLKAVFSYCSRWKFLGWVASTYFLPPPFTGRVDGEEQD